MVNVNCKVFRVVACLFALSPFQVSNVLAQKGPPTVYLEAMVESIPEDLSSLLVVPVEPKNHFEPVAPRRYITVFVSKELRTLVQEFHKGDIVVLQVNEVDGKLGLEGISPKTIPISGLMRMLVLVASALGLLILAAILLRQSPHRVVVGVDSRYSNSQFQMALWFSILVVTYIATNFLRGLNGGICFVGGVNIPQYILMLSGASAITFVAAKGITNYKDVEAKAKGIATPKPPAPQPSFPSDLVCNDLGKPDFGDFQMFIITLIAVGVYIVQVYKFLGTIQLLRVVTLPEVDTTLLSTFGLGQGAYLIKKYVGRIGES